MERPHRCEQAGKCFLLPDVQLSWGRAGSSSCFLALLPPFSLLCFATGPPKRGEFPALAHCFCDFLGSPDRRECLRPVFRLHGEELNRPPVLRGSFGAGCGCREKTGSELVLPRESLASCPHRLPPQPQTPTWEQSLRSRERLGRRVMLPGLSSPAVKESELC